MGTTAEELIARAEAAERDARAALEAAGMGPADRQGLLARLRARLGRAELERVDAAWLSRRPASRARTRASCPRLPNGIRI
jgi:hypothetical protein